MLRQNLLRTFLFVVFFSIGAAALCGSILCDDLLQYYHDRQRLKAEDEYINQLKSLITDYDVLLPQIEEDPNILERIAPATLGTRPENKDTIYPKATPRQLNAARKALMGDCDRQGPEPAVPEWITRCSRPPRRIILFLAGASLILISFMCFGPAKQ